MLLRERFWSADSPLHWLDAREANATLLAMLGILSTPEGRGQPILVVGASGQPIAGELGLAGWPGGAVALPFALAAVPCVHRAGRSGGHVARLTVSDAGLSRFITILQELAGSADSAFNNDDPFTERSWRHWALDYPHYGIIGLMYRYHHSDG